MKRLQQLISLVILCLSVIILARIPDAKANFITGGMIGYGQGFLSQGEESSTVAGIPYMGYIGYSLNDTYSFYFFSQNIDLGYDQGDARHVGNYSLYGPGVGLHFFGAKARWFSVLVNYGLSGTYTTIAESKATINDFEYKTSNYTKLEGTGAIQAYLGYESISYSNRGNHLFYGFYGGYLNQSFQKKTAKITSNSDNLEPLSPGSSEGNYTLNFLSIMISIQYSF